MIDPKKVNMNELPKKFVDGAIGAYGKEIFSFALTSGNNLDSFATTPQVMKSIAVWINGQVQNYENQFGEIVVNKNCETNISGLYAAGDVTDVPFNQIVIAAGQGCIATLSAVQYLNKSR